MPSFDIVSQVDLQEVDNAVNNVKKEIGSRYDFRGVNTQVTFNRKDKKIHILTGDEMKIKAVRELLSNHCVRRKLDPRIMDFSKPEGTSQGQLKQQVSLKEGIDKDTAKKLVRLIKDSRLKVQAAIQENQVRVTGKKIDDLQAVIRRVKEGGFDQPFQFVNMK